MEASIWHKRSMTKILHCIPVLHSGSKLSTAYFVARNLTIKQMIDNCTRICFNVMQHIVLQKQISKSPLLDWLLATNALASPFCPSPVICRLLSASSPWLVAVVYRLWLAEAPPRSSTDVDVVNCTKQLKNDSNLKFLIINLITE